MGRLSFTEYFHLLLTGREPTEEQRFFLDLLLVAIAEHGMMPTNVAARMTLAADPGSLQGAVAAGILGCGPVILGTAEECARLLEERAASASPRARTRARSPRDVGSARCASAGEQAARLRPSRPPAARPARRADPRARRRARRERPRTCCSRAASATAAAEAWGKPLTMNVSMPIAAVMLDLGFAAAAVKAVPILARTAGLLAHLAEEREQPDRLPDGRPGGGGDRATSLRTATALIELMLAPEVETRPWDEQLALDDAPTAPSSRYLFERSAFYREKLAAAGSARRARAAGSPRSRGSR